MSMKNNLLKKNYLAIDKLGPFLLNKSNLVGCLKLLLKGLKSSSNSRYFSSGA